MLFRVALAILIWPGPAFAVATEEARATAVVFNSSDPESVSLAKYYASQRKIPEKNLIGLRCSREEQITRQEFLATLWYPLRAEMELRGLWRMDEDKGNVLMTSIRFLAIIKGVPLKVQADPAASPRPGQPDPIAQRSEAAVDSELATLAMPPSPPSGVVSNPYYRRFTPVLDSETRPYILAVSRLDGPSAGVVRLMIDGAQAAERDGLWGWAYIDSRGLKGGPYQLGDQWLMNLAANMQRNGLPVWLDDSGDTLPAGFPLSDLAVYYGWYAGNADGPFADPTLRFRPGAIAVHIHSFSASTVRSLTKNWCGPLLARGAAATLGNVYEPYLALTAELDIVQDRLMAGFTFAESVLMASRALSWMGVALGDPLYRPYASWRQAADRSPNLSSWQRFRRIVLDAGGDIFAAAPALRVASEESGQPLFLEALGAAQLAAGKTGAAGETFHQIDALDPPRDTRFRIELARFRSATHRNDKQEAARSLTAMESLPTSRKSDQLLRKLRHQLFPPPPESPPPKKSPPDTVR